MSQPLPYGKFKWLKPGQIEFLENAEYADQYATDKFGYIFEVDLEYPEELHDLHNDYPLAPSKVNTSDLVLSDYCNKTITREANRYIFLISMRTTYTAGLCRNRFRTVNSNG